LGKYIKKSISPEWPEKKKANLRNHMRMTGVREGAPEIRGMTWDIPFELHEWIENQCLFRPAAACPGCAERKDQLQNKN
jgi:hypothetical protein